jgi:hypothetical protein
VTSVLSSLAGGVAFWRGVNSGPFAERVFFTNAPDLNAALCS